jgi:hypothetical protein
MYYEVHGSGKPLVLLHGGVGSIEMSGEGPLPLLAAGDRSLLSICRLTGRTADIDRPLSFGPMAGDIAA